MADSLWEWVNGVVEEAVKRSDRIGRSDVAVAVYPLDGWVQAFRRAYHVRSFVPVQGNETFSESLADWLGEALAMETTVALNARFGTPVAVLRAENETALLSALSSSEHRFGAFYTTEDAFFAVFETHVLAFLMGNFD